MRRFVVLACFASLLAGPSAAADLCRDLLGGLIPCDELPDLPLPSASVPPLPSASVPPLPSVPVPSVSPSIPVPTVPPVGGEWSSTRITPSPGATQAPSPPGEASAEPSTRRPQEPAGSGPQDVRPASDAPAAPASATAASSSGSPPWAPFAAALGGMAATAGAFALRGRRRRSMAA